MALTNKRADSLKQALEIKDSKLNGINLKLNRTQAKLDTVIKYNRICFERIVTYERKGLKKIRNERIVEIACPN
jgi:hypothetical protein